MNGKSGSRCNENESCGAAGRESFDVGLRVGLKLVKGQIPVRGNVVASG